MKIYIFLFLSIIFTIFAVHRYYLIGLQKEKHYNDEQNKILDNEFKRGMIYQRKQDSSIYQNKLNYNYENNKRWPFKIS